VNVDEILGQLERVHKTGRGWSARCPAHEDRNPSLSIAEGDDGRILLRCFAGCPTDRVCGSLGLKLSDLFAGDRFNHLHDWRPSTPEERQAAENSRLRRQVRALKLERRRADVALGRAAILIAIAYSDEPTGVLERLWRGAVAQLEAEAAAQAQAEAEAAL
jgi:hypothetical protein